MLLVSGSLEAVGRVVLLSFPYSWILASRQHPVWRYGWPVLSVALLAIFSTLTFAGWWIPYPVARPRGRPRDGVVRGVGMPRCGDRHLPRRLRHRHRVATTADRRHRALRLRGDPGVASGGGRIDYLGAAIVAVHCVIFLVFPFRADPGPPPPDDLYRIFPAIVLIGLGIGAVLTAIRRDLPAMTAALVVAVAVGIVFRVVIVASDTPPFFDVFYIQEAAGDALLSGIDPYLTQVWVNGYLYLPVAAIAAAAGELIGDARWASVAGDLMVIAALPLFARRVGASTRAGLALAAVWAWWAAGFYIIWQGFPEPILIGFAALAAAALAGERPRTVLGGVLVGLAAATKQFGLGLIPFLPLDAVVGKLSSRRGSPGSSSSSPSPSGTLTASSKAPSSRSSGNRRETMRSTYSTGPACRSIHRWCWSS